MNNNEVDSHKQFIHEKDKELLAGFHHTISEQLNSRLSESPKFFALLVVVGTGYGYVATGNHLNKLFLPVSLLAYSATLWAGWYLAALGYSFRFLQYSQRRIEQELRWSRKFVPRQLDGREAGDPPKSGFGFNAFWLLPSIYHGHVAALCLLQIFIWGSFGRIAWGFHPHRQIVGLEVVMDIVGAIFLWLVNYLYFRKFSRISHLDKPTAKS